MNLAEAYSKQPPYNNSYDLILPLTGQGAADKDRYFTSFFVQDQPSQDSGVRELETLDQNNHVISLYKAYCQEHKLNIAGLDGPITEDMTQRMTTHFESEVETINSSENIHTLIEQNNFSNVIKVAKHASTNSKITVSDILTKVTIPQAPVSFMDICCNASMRRRMAGFILPFEIWSHSQEMLSQLVVPEHGVKSDSERISLIRFLYQSITGQKKSKFAEQYSRIMFDLYMFLCYDCGLQLKVLGPASNSRNQLQPLPKMAELQLSIAGFLKGGLDVQTAHRDVTGMNSKDPKPQSGSILAVLKGIRRLKIRDTVYTLSPGQAIWFDGDVLHNGMDNPPDSLALHMHIDDKSFFRVAYDFDLEE
jgi:hypothetical protein